MRVIMAVFLLAGLWSGGSAYAKDCSNEQTQTDLTICAVDNFNEADAELNAAYKQMTDRLKPEPDTLKLLVEAQRAWIGFRDAECTYATSATVGGTIHPMMEAECREGLTRKRTADLNGYINCEEGDLSCPLLPE